MKDQLDKVGAAGTIFSAVSAAAPCCLPLLASVGASLGLGVFLPYQNVMTYVLQFFVILALAGSYFSFRRHRNKWPFALGVAGSIAILAAYNIEFSAALIYSGLLGLLIATLWNTLEIRHCAPCNIKQIIFQSTITCPFCGFQSIENMPVDACQYFYECSGCKIILKPKQGDCCVFCTYGSVKCPSIQAEERCVTC